MQHTAMNKVDRSSYFNETERRENTTCKLCNGKIDYGFHMVCKLDGIPVHDYCVRTKLNQ